MFISRMPLNVERAQTMRLISSPYRIHAAVEHAFAPGANRFAPDGRILWRVDASVHDKDVLWLYVVSPDRPDFSHLCEQVGWPTTTRWECKDYSPVISSIQEGQVWQFRLKANPSRRAARDRGLRPNAAIVGKTMGHVTVGQQIDWLVDRAACNGFEVLQGESATPLVNVSHRKIERFARGGETVTLSTARFDGLLRVTDKDAFKQVLCRGLGRAKGFGCGLMTIAPARRSAG